MVGYTRIRGRVVIVEGETEIYKYKHNYKPG
jgi:hypothetical protein